MRHTVVLLFTSTLAACAPAGSPDDVTPDGTGAPTSGTPTSVDGDATLDGETSAIVDGVAFSDGDGGLWIDLVTWEGASCAKGFDELGWLSPVESWFVRLSPSGHVDYYAPVSGGFGLASNEYVVAELQVSPAAPVEGDRVVGTARWDTGALAGDVAFDVEHCGADD